MELRSGALIASGTGFTSAEQARAACMGQARVQLAAQHRPAFEAAVRGVLLRWTALRLAVENGWGGESGDGSAAELEQSIIAWFLAKGDHYADELEDHLDEFMVEVFHVEAEDGSPAEVATLLVHLFEAVASGDYALAQQLSAPLPTLSAVEQSQRDLSDKRWTLEHGAGRESAALLASRPDISPDELAAALGGMQAGGGEAEMEEESSSSESEAEDGWEKVPVRKGSGGRRR